MLLEGSTCKCSFQLLSSILNSKCKEKSLHMLVQGFPQKAPSSLCFLLYAAFKAPEVHNDHFSLKKKSIQDRACSHFLCMLQHSRAAACYRNHFFLLNTYLQDCSHSKASSSVQTVQCCHFYLLYIVFVAYVYVFMNI